MLHVLINTNRFPAASGWSKASSAISRGHLPTCKAAFMKEGQGMRYGAG